MNGAARRIAVVYPSGRVRKERETLQERILAVESLGFGVQELELFHESHDDTAMATALERAAMVSHALTRRMYDIVWAARGGYGATALVPFLKNMLPPVLPKKIVVGFSDVSFLGVTLALQYPSVTYVHGRNFFSEDLLSSSEHERRLLLDILQGVTPAPVCFPTEVPQGCRAPDGALEGWCIPLNLSLAESLAVLPEARLPAGSVLFLEDIGEPLYRILRKFDSLLNSGFLENVSAIVLGSFADCVNSGGVQVTEAEVARALSERIRLPIFTLPIFGHGDVRYPLVALSRVSLRPRKGGWEAEVRFERECRAATAEIYAPPQGEKARVHFTGIGGTGMAAVAGLFKEAGYAITGSDTPIFPPMDRVISEMGVDPYVGYLAENIVSANPDAVVLSNVVSRKNASLQGNPELEKILDDNVPMLSFPSALRRFFLRRANNIVVTGTHGKTTTTSLMAHTLREAGVDPSLFVGGAPKNYPSGYHLGNKDVFILEGDEYDTAFFDKGPKFLHYEPTVALMNNIEFDHADIYDSVEAIECEFVRLAELTAKRGGIVVANLAESRVMRVAEASPAPVLAFGPEKGPSRFPAWHLLGTVTEAEGSLLQVRTPWGENLEVRTAIFGDHNALNTVASLASIHAWFLLRDRNFIPVSQDELAELVKKPMSRELLKGVLRGLASFQGVTRRFELVGMFKNIAVFDDFAHHPTAIDTTLRAFRSYMGAAKRGGRLIACFEPRNATMRRRVLEGDLAHSLKEADIVLLGKVPQDLRIPEEERMNGVRVAKAIGPEARAFDDNEALFEHLRQSAVAGDTVVFMGPSGAFSGLPVRLVDALRAT